MYSYLGFQVNIRCVAVIDNGAGQNICVLVCDSPRYICDEVVDMGVLVVLVSTWYRFNESKTSTKRLTSGLSGFSKSMHLLVSLLCRKRDVRRKRYSVTNMGCKRGRHSWPDWRCMGYVRGPNVPSHAITYVIIIWLVFVADITHTLIGQF